MKLEVSTYNIEGVIEAYRLGADRVELCDNIKEGGTTPSYGFIKKSLDVDHPEVFIIVRPRGGDFLYTEYEFDIMKNDIKMAKKLGIDGVVSGVLLANGNIDIVRTKELVELSKPMKFTFHRAFDMTKGYKKSIAELIDIGVDIVLTSGMENKAEDGLAVLKELVETSRGEIEILVGSGVNPNNMEKIYIDSGITNFHMSAVKEIESEMTFFNKRLSMGNVEAEEYTKLTVDSNKIEGAVKVINQLRKL
jgi:copper homeostasis protein